MKNDQDQNKCCLIFKFKAIEYTREKTQVRTKF